MQNKEKLISFINDNGLSFLPGTRNSSCTTLCGFATHLKASVDEVKEAIFSKYPLDAELNKEVDRVFDFANKRDYASFWTTEKAKAQYKF